MAKSTSFFGLRRGSTKSLTFQVLDGKQVTKDRVAVVKNPKTSRQAEQRAKLLPAIRFMAIFSGIIDHSFENVAYGQKSKQHFLSMAMKTQPTNPMLKGQKGWYPQEYVMSEGSLPTLNALVPSFGAKTGMRIAYLTATGNDPYAALVRAGKVQEGDQLTFIAVTTGAAQRVLIDRIILNAETMAPNDDGEWYTQNGVFTIQIGLNGLTASSGDGEADGYIACCAIQSRRTSNKWLRSTETMQAFSVDSAGWENSVASYMDAASELSSPWYLNAANNDVVSPEDIAGGEWSPVMLGPSQNWGSNTTIYLGAKNNLYGNYAVVTSDGTSGGFAFTFEGLSSGKTIKDVVLSDFTQSQTRGNAVMPEAVEKYGTFGSDTLTALAEGQPDQFAKASAVGK